MSRFRACVSRFSTVWPRRSTRLRATSTGELAPRLHEIRQEGRSVEKLVGDLSGAFSRRINIHHRLVYQVIESEHLVKVLRVWSQYE
ncbi:MAG: type II toxin-antitoxin system mRNA interferase toxin, RelE/StbE family [Actinobacteria bacterium]|nr:MAG: type II toxin-antitoxin system mRNA interferase toxin, RelE/StbE family [Actinomycetota bacterium]